MYCKETEFRVERYGVVSFFNIWLVWGLLLCFYFFVDAKHSLFNLVHILHLIPIHPFPFSIYTPHFCLFSFTIINTIYRLPGNDKKIYSHLTQANPQRRHDWHNPLPSTFYPRPNTPYTLTRGSNLVLVMLSIYTYISSSLH